MDNVNAFDSFNEFFPSHPDVQWDELLHLSESLRYYHRLNGKTLDDITVAMKSDYKQVYKIASELEIFRYSDHSLPKQRELIFEKFNTIFSKRKLCDEDSTQPDPNNKKRKHASKCIRREVWNHYIGEEHGTHACFCCDITVMSQFLFEVGHVVSVHNNGDLSIENLRPICSLCNKSMGTRNMLEFIKEQNLAGLKNFVN